jgi:hypothetical protein
MDCLQGVSNLIWYKRCKFLFYTSLNLNKLEDTRFLKFVKIVNNSSRYSDSWAVVPQTNVYVFARNEEYLGL